eukprot:5158978-Lingulodinium_polyedra.AAC.1
MPPRGPPPPRHHPVTSPSPLRHHPVSIPPPPRHPYYGPVATLSPPENGMMTAWRRGGNGAASGTGW